MINVLRASCTAILMTTFILSGCGADAVNDLEVEELATGDARAIPDGTPGEVSSAFAAASTCSPGWVCIYEGDIWDGGTNHRLAAQFYRYGTYNLSGIVGNYTVRNCQTDGARVALYSGYNATGSVLWDLGDNCLGGLWADLTPVNSVRLYEV